MSRVTEIRYVGYATPDVEAERKFYGEVWGLKEIREEDGLVYFATHGHDGLYVVRLRQSHTPHIDIIALATETRADVDALFLKVKAAGNQIIFEPKELTTFGGGYGFRFFSTDGLSFEISAEVETGQSRPLEPREGIPERISHIVLHSPDHRAQTQFFIDVLGFKLSDWISDFMSFLRCNSAHHRIAFLPGPPCLNHVAYDMRSVDEMMRGIARLKRKSVDVKWGPGRHTAGNNTFSYFTTPNGFAVEYTSELEHVDDATWEPQVYAAEPHIMDQWGTGTGGPQTMPKPAADSGLFRAAVV